MSLRQQLVDAVLARFALITTANSYQTNIGANLEEWRTTPLGENETNFLNVRDTEDVIQPDPQGPNSGKRTWALLISAEAVMAETGQNAQHARKAIADIKKAIAIDQTWGGLARRTDEVSDSLMHDRSGARLGGALVQFKIVTSRQPFAA